MKKRIFDLREEGRSRLLDIVSYGRGLHLLTGVGVTVQLAREFGDLHHWRTWEGSFAWTNGHDARLALTKSHRLPRDHPLHASLRQRIRMPRTAATLHKVDFPPFFGDMGSCGLQR